MDDKLLSRIGMWFGGMVLLFALSGLIVPGAYCGVAVLGLYLHFFLDRLFSAALIPGAPWVMWGIWGGIMGGMLGFWSVAPRYGLGEKRILLVFAPLVLLLLVAGITLLLVKTTF
jgi:hypothetical protein